MMDVAGNPVPPALNRLVVADGGTHTPLIHPMPDRATPALSGPTGVATHQTGPSTDPAGAVGGDRPGDGWADLMSEHRADLVRIARMRLSRDLSGSDAEDVVHEVFLRMVRRGPELAEVGRPVAYLRRAIANECVTRSRRHREWAVEQTPELSEPDHAERCAIALTVRRALVELTPRQRSVVVLGFLHGYSDAELSSALGIAPVTVRTLRRRALDRLRNALSAQEPNSTIRSGVSRSTTRTVPSGSASYGRPRYFSDSESISSLPPSSVMVTRPRISA